VDGCAPPVPDTVERVSSVLGIDVSSHAIDMVKLDETSNDAEWTRFELQGADSFTRLRDVRSAMPGVFTFYEDVYIAGIEVPKSRYLKTAAALFPVYGAVVACLPTRLQVWDVHPKTWRQSLGLLGNASKLEVATAVRQILWDTSERPYDDWGRWKQDAYDAYAVAYHVRETNLRAILEEEPHPERNPV